MSTSSARRARRARVPVGTHRRTTRACPSASLDRPCPPPPVARSRLDPKPSSRSSAARGHPQPGLG
eukprot:1183601-Prorocentrum_minimum.AAC.3